MLIVDSYAVAVGLCFITMLCWGSWANTLKLASREWPFPLYYWDYALGLVLTSLLLGLTLGSMGSEGRAFVPDLRQASGGALVSAFLGGVVFNIANLLVVAAIDVAGTGRGLPGGDRPGPGGRRHRELRGDPPGQPRPSLRGGGARRGGHPRGRARLREAALGEGGDGQGPHPLRPRRLPHGLLLPLRGRLDDHGLPQPAAGAAHAVLGDVRVHRPASSSPTSSGTPSSCTGP